MTGWSCTNTPKPSTPGTSAQVMTPSTPGIASASRGVDARRCARARAAMRSTAMCSMCGITMSPAYFSAPDTLLGASRRRTLAPMKAPSAGSSSASALAGRRPLLHVARQLDRVENLLIAGAAADVAAEPLLDLLAVRERIGAQRRGGGHHHAGDAVAALAGAGLVERLLQHATARPLCASPSTVSIAVPCAFADRHQAGLQQHAVDEHRAGAAFAGAAAFLGAGVAADRRAGSRAGAGAAWRCARPCGR